MGVLFLFLFSLSRARDTSRLSCPYNIYGTHVLTAYSFIALQLHHTKKTMGDKAKEEFAKVFARLLHSFRAIHSLRLRMLTESRENKIRYLRVRGRHCDTFSSPFSVAVILSCEISFWRHYNDVFKALSCVQLLLHLVRFPLKVTAD